MHTCRETGDGSTFPWQHHHHGPVTVSSQRTFLFSHIFLLGHTFADVLFCFGANVCQRSTVSRCSSSLLLRFWFFPHSTAGLCSVCGVCLAFIRCLLMLYPHAFEVVFIFNALGLSWFLLWSSCSILFPFKQQSGGKAYSLVYSLQGTTWWRCTVPEPTLIFLGQKQKQTPIVLIFKCAWGRGQKAVESRILPGGVERKRRGLCFYPMHPH